MAERTGLRDKVAVVTGAAAGLGCRMALDFASEGASVVAVDRDEEGVEETRALLGPDNSSSLSADLLQDGSAEKIVGAAVDAFGGLDILVNCAGIFPTSPALEISVGQWDAVLGTNLRAPFLISQAAARWMVDRGRPGMVDWGRPGNVVNIASSAAAVARPGIAHYCASKAGLVMLTKALAVEWAEHGIRVNAVAPGLVETPGVEELLRTEEGRAEHQRKVARIPMSRPAGAREVSEAVLFLASDAAAFVMGETLFVDGGYSAGRTFRG